MEKTEETKIIMDGIVDDETFIVNGKVLRPLDLVVTQDANVIKKITENFKGTVYTDDSYVDVVKGHFKERDRIREEAQKNIE